MKTGQKGIDLVKHFEQIHDGDLTEIGLQAKLCAAGYWTVGYGHVLIYNGKMLKGLENEELANRINPIHTEQEAEKMLLVDLMKTENQINSLQLGINQDQFDALVSIIYNCGFYGILNSTLLRRIRSKTGDMTEAFLMWVNVNHKPLKGLILRREAEARLFLTGELKL